jgi:hypothetical protein
VTDSFIGRRFGKSNQIEVICQDGVTSSGHDKVYRVVCHICNLDPELFGDGQFLIAKSSLTRGSTPCACESRVYRWTLAQCKVRVERECSKRNYTFLGFVEDFAGNSTKIKLRCNLDGNEWSNLRASALLTSKVGCRVCANNTISEKNGYTDEHCVEKFFEVGKFPSGTIFGRCKSRGNKWKYRCGVCSDDIFVKNGLCSGLFNSSYANLSVGKKSCRCSRAYRWTAQQREFQVKSTLEYEGLKYNFVGWEDNYKNVGSKIVLNCDVHGNWPVNIHSFLAVGNRCPDCATSGYKKGVDAGFYILKVEGRHSFIGFGVSNTPDRRLHTHARNLKRAGLKIVATQIFYVTGQQAWNIEQVIKKRFPCNPQDIEGFKTEATYYEYYQEVVDFVDKLIFDSRENS